MISTPWEIAAALLAGLACAAFVLRARLRPTRSPVERRPPPPEQPEPRTPAVGEAAA
ncbi:hypothetical protein ACL03H_03845 [Saccharopolyspora sp. MS10]|uniref:hypothetical protein n=1 Tax=Saccharopolyspora sp. MS10 TaxID=3385973 RepID=UPI0039A2F050